MRRPDHRPEVKAPPRWLVSRTRTGCGSTTACRCSPATDPASTSQPSPWCWTLPLNAEPRRGRGRGDHHPALPRRGHHHPSGPGLRRTARGHRSRAQRIGRVRRQRPAARGAGHPAGRGAAVAGRGRPGAGTARRRRPAARRSLRLAEIDHTLANSARPGAGGLPRGLHLQPLPVLPAWPAARAETVAAITGDDVAAYHRRNYRPDGATLVIAGDLTNEVVRPGRRGVRRLAGAGNDVHPSPDAGLPPPALLADRPARRRAGRHPARRLRHRPRRPALGGPAGGQPMPSAAPSSAG